VLRRRLQDWTYSFGIRAPRGEARKEGDLGRSVSRASSNRLIGSVTLPSVISDFNSNGFWIHVHERSPPDGRFRRLLTRGGFDALGRFLIVT